MCLKIGHKGRVKQEEKKRRRYFFLPLLGRSISASRQPLLLFLEGGRLIEPIDLLGLIDATRCHGGAHLLPFAFSGWAPRRISDFFFQNPKKLTFDFLVPKN